MGVEPLEAVGPNLESAVRRPEKIYSSISFLFFDSLLVYIEADLPPRLFRK